MKEILSVQNPDVKHLVKLHKKSYRTEHKQFIAQGLTVCTTLIDQQYKCVALYLTSQAIAHSTQFDQELITVVSEPVMNKISTNTTPSGIVGLFQIPTPVYKPTTNSIVLHNIQDPGNMGTLIRTAAAMDIDNVFLIEGVDPYGPKVIQATAGTIAYLQIISTNWQQFLQEHNNLHTTALVVDNGQQPTGTNLSSILVIGNEGQGLPQEVVQDCTNSVTLPMPGKTESLNAAVAGSISMYLKKKSILNKELYE